MEKIRFLFIGGVNFCWGLCSYPLLFELLKSWLNYLTILIIAYVINSAVSYTSQKYLVFQSKGKHKTQIFKFILFQVGLLLLNLLVLPLLVNSTGLSPAVAQPIFAIFIAFASYFIHKSFTFK